MNGDEGTAPGRRPAPAGAAAQVFLRPIGTSLPLGLFAVAVASGLLSARELDLLSPGESLPIALATIGFAFPLQFLAAVLAFLARDSLAGSVLGVFSGVWLTSGLSLLVLPPGASNDALGAFYMLVAAVLLLIFVAGGTTKLAIGAVVGAGCVRLLVTGLSEILDRDPVTYVAGIVGLVLSAIAFYSAFALLVEDTRHRTILPLLRRGEAREALEPGLEPELSTLDREPGVRRQL